LQAAFFVSNLKSDLFQKNVKKEVIDGVEIYCRNPKKADYIKQALKACKNIGFEVENFDNLKISVSPTENKKRGLSLKVRGECNSHYDSTEEKLKSEISLISGVNWNTVEEIDRRIAPFWAKKVASGFATHFILHEIGHYPHHRNRKDSL
jgi:hypothetical protein